MAISPIAAPGRKKTLSRVASGAKRGNLLISAGENGAMVRSMAVADLPIGGSTRTACQAERSVLMSRGANDDFCYSMTWQFRSFGISYHDLVIALRQCNKLKDRPK
jgi:hypothetical protein